jgi:hypothetical protein
MSLSFTKVKTNGSLKASTYTEWKHAPTSVEYIVVAGGGSGGNQEGGGGGAGGLTSGIYSSLLLDTIYTVSIGGGGPATVTNTTSQNGVNGTNSSFIGAVAYGGGYGSSPGVASPAAGIGGSGGGGAAGGAGASGIVGQGFAGGTGFVGTSYGGGGGGGAGGLGANGNASYGGAGGIGYVTNFYGNTTYFAGGGGGGTYDGVSPSYGGLGGLGGGGRGGGTVTSGIAFAGNTNTGGGGGGGMNQGGTYNASGAGGSGVVLLRYPSTYADAITTGANVTYANGYTIYTFVQSGTIKFLPEVPIYVTNTTTVSGGTFDPSFSNVTLLLNGNGASANNFLSDASTTNSNITIFGGTRPTNFNPYQNGYYSNYFNGSTYIILDAAASTAVNALAANPRVTMEFWVNTQAIQAVTAYNTAIFGQFPSVAQNSRYEIELYASSTTSAQTVSFTWTTGTGTTDNVTTTASINQKTWNHIAITLDMATPSSTTIKIFINGVSQTFTGKNLSTHSADNGNPTHLGGSYGGGLQYITGYISNFRFSKALIYTNDFTPSTVPLTASANTVLLTCQGPGIVDKSANAYALTNSSATVDPAAPFIPLIDNNGSTYFNGSSDWLSATSPDLSGTWTVEMWCYWTTSATQTTMISFNNGSFTGINIWKNSSNQLVVDDGANAQTAFTPVVTINAWNHIAIVRNGATTSAYINGVLAGSNSFTPTTTSAVSIGRYNGSPFYYFSGYISDVRITNGTALYTAAFTPPTAPLSPVTNTNLLTLQNKYPVNNHTFLDDSVNKSFITRFGNASQGSFSPYGDTWSTYFDGTSNLQTPASSITSIIGTNGLTTSSAFTIECWMYNTTRTSDGLGEIVGDMSPDAGTNYWSFGPTSTGAIAFYWYNSGQRFATGSTIIPVNTWAHIAVVINGTNIKMFVNGNLETLSGTTTNDGTSGSLGYISVGRWQGGGATYGYYGYISNLRITKDALYSANFTPSTIPLTSTVTTGLLTCQSRSFVDNGPNSYSLTISGTLSAQKFSPFPRYVLTANTYTRISNYQANAHGGSVYFDTSGDYLSIPASGVSDFGTGDFTVEMWINPSSLSSYNMLYSVSGANGYLCLIWGATSSVFGLNAYNGVQLVNSSASTTSINQWTHIAFVRASGTLYFYINGVASGSGGFSSAFGSSSGTISIGYNPAYAGSGYYTNASISNLRVVKGTAVYTSSFVPSTSPLVPVGNTSLLLNMTNAAIYDTSMATDIETVGDAKISTAIKKYGSASMYFDGTGDYLNGPNNITLSVGTEDFTIECWFYTTVGTNNGIFQISDTAGGFKTSYTNSLSMSLLGGKLNTYGIAGTGATSTGASYTDSTWHHLAVVRSNGVTKIYADGALDTTFGTAGAITDTTNYSGTYIVVGGYYSTSYLWNGYIDDFRITRGQARYTANFTPPTQEFVDDTRYSTSTSTTTLVNY